MITEQNIHALDVATWIVNAEPAQGRTAPAARRAAQDPGTCNDNFAVIFTFPDDVLVTFASKQYGTGYDDIGCRMFGPKGTVDTHYFGVVMIRGEKSYKGGKTRQSLHRRGGPATSPTSTPASSRATAPTRPSPPACGAT